ncbi:MAG TPA: hypothetical protein VIG30_00925 [Ktedonobacterales bacterium]
MTRRRVAVFAAAALLAAGIALFFLDGGIVWLKVFGGVMMGAGGTRLVLAVRQPARAS